MPVCSSPTVQTPTLLGDRSTPSNQMADYAKFILMVQPMSLQGAIWQSILRSQNISVLWEAADVDLPSTLNHLREKGLNLPDLVLIDTRIQTFNAYSFCRWCQKHFPDLKIVLINGAQKDVTPSEREWALHQGATDLLPRFRKDSLVSAAVIRVRLILDLLGCPALNQGTLVSSLLTIQRVAQQPSTHSPSYSHHPRYSGQDSF